MKKAIWTIRVITLLMVSFIFILTCCQVQAEEITKVPREQVIMVADSGTVGSHLNPLNLASSSPSSACMYDPLAIYDPAKSTGMDYIPILAKNWKWVDDTTFEIYLRPEAHFWDGSPVTASDVIFSLESYNKYSGLLTGLFEELKSMEVVDKNTVRINLKPEAANSLRVMQIFTQQYGIFSKERWSKLIDKYGKNIIEFRNLDRDEINASGRWRPLFVSSDKVIMKRVENYWGEKTLWYTLPKYFGVLYTETEPKMEELADEGVVDIPTGIAETQWKHMKNPKRWGCWNIEAESRALKSAPAEGYHREILFNFARVPLFQKQWLRYAMAYAINTPEAAIMGGEAAAKPSPTFLPKTPSLKPYVDEELVKRTFETERGVNGVLGIKYDPKKAIEILENHCEGSPEEGWWFPNKETGEKLGGWTLVTVNGWPGWMIPARVYCQQWKKIGLDIDYKFLEYGAWAANFQNLDWDLNMTCPSPASSLSPADTYTRNFIGTLADMRPWENSPCAYTEYFTEKYKGLPNTAKQVKGLIKELWHHPVGSKESIEIAKKIQEIVVPQLPMIPGMSSAAAPGIHWRNNYWVNWPTKDDPYRFATAEKDFAFFGQQYPRSVKTISFTLSSDEVKAGEPVTAKVTLKNTGNYDHRYAVYVRKGHAKPGPGPEPLASKATIVPAGGTKDVELEVRLDEPGSYTLTVDDWRIGKYDPGDPIEKTLIVTR